MLSEGRCARPNKWLPGLLWHTQVLGAWLWPILDPDAIRQLSCLPLGSARFPRFVRNACDSLYLWYGETDCFVRVPMPNKEPEPLCNRCPLRAKRKGSGNFLYGPGYITNIRVGETVTVMEISQVR
ncbi:MAG: hypothetical protein AW07_04455 [Candidatus Accumulibacter sp. SK-11]|nr:MAG: hypothetical protein AW07_04455 [Candidatus Accumulibacter sp. SK-11]